MKDAFRNEGGAIDLASIMVGIIVIGLIGGVIAATVFAVIPWSQDNAAKHQLDSIVAAQSAYMGLSSDSPPALPAGHKANSFADSASLADANLLQMGSTYCAVITDEGKGYQGLSQSASGKVWSVLDSNTKPVNLGHGSIAPDCSFISGGTPDENGSETGNNNDAETPYVDPTPTKTILTYKCDVTNTNRLPMRDNLNGDLTVTGDNGSNFEKSYSDVAYTNLITMEKGITYTVTFDGTYSTFNSTGLTSTDCLRSLDHWGANTGVTSAYAAFYFSSNLTTVPEHIPSTITDMGNMFGYAKLFNDPNISKWDVSNVKRFDSMFHTATAFDQPLNGWKTSSATSMNAMFMLTSYNQPLDKWDTSNVKIMSSMFNNNAKFNQPLESWNVSNVTDMSYMFNKASKFDQPLNEWTVSNVTNMSHMFAYASVFNQPLNEWDVSKVIDMDWMFIVSPFKQDLSDWKFKVKVPAHSNFSTTIPAGNMPNWVLTP